MRRSAVGGEDALNTAARIPPHSGWLGAGAPGGVRGPCPDAANAESITNSQAKPNPRLIDPLLNDECFEAKKIWPFTY